MCQCWKASLLIAPLLVHTGITLRADEEDNSEEGSPEDAAATTYTNQKAAANSTFASETTAFCLAGASGNNALRMGGVYHGLFEAWASSTINMLIFAMMIKNGTNEAAFQNHRQVLLHRLHGVHSGLQKNTHWKCLREDCNPSIFVEKVVRVTIAEKDSDAHAKDMQQTFKIDSYKDVIVYLSLPPKVFSTIAQASRKHWGERLHLVAEKPFGTSAQSAQELLNSIVQAGVPQSNVHLVDHFLAFWMMRTMSDMKQIAMSKLGISWDGNSFEKIEFWQGEDRGVDGRGAFFEKVGQGRDMIQSHMLQVMAAALAAPEVNAHTADETAKLSVLEGSNMSGCEFGQYEGFLRENGLGWHGEFADATYMKVHVQLEKQWKDVDVEIVSAKAVDKNYYEIRFYQKEGEGVLTFEIGQHKFGFGGISVKKWPLKSASEFQAPIPGLGLEITSTTISNVPAIADGYILKYDLKDRYFPSAYSVLMQALLQGEYTSNFVTWAECLKMWEVMACLDPPPGEVKVYQRGQKFGEPLPDNKTVADLYNEDFECSAEHNKTEGKTTLYVSKCCGGRDEKTDAWNVCT